MYLVVTLIVTLFGVLFLFLPQLEGVRTANKDLVTLVQTMIGTLTGVFLAMQLSVWKQKRDERDNISKLLEGTKTEALETLNNMQSFKELIAKCDPDSSEHYSNIMNSNSLPRLLILESLLANDLATKHLTSNALRTFSQVQRNMSTLSDWTKDEMNMENAYKIVYGYIHEIEFAITSIDIELRNLKSSLSKKELTDLYNQEIMELKRKNDYVKSLIAK